MFLQWLPTRDYENVTFLHPIHQPHNPLFLIFNSLLEFLAMLIFSIYCNYANIVTTEYRCIKYFFLAQFVFLGLNNCLFCCELLSQFSILASEWPLTSQITPALFWVSQPCHVSFKNWGELCFLGNIPPGTIFPSSNPQDLSRPRWAAATLDAASPPFW